MSSAAPESSTCVVLGAGSWGTALAIQLARLSRPAVLWGRDRAHAAALASQRSNERYLPQGRLDPIEQYCLDFRSKSGQQDVNGIYIGIDEGDLSHGEGCIVEVAGSNRRKPRRS